MREQASSRSTLGNHQDGNLLKQTVEQGKAPWPGDEWSGRRRRATEPNPIRWEIRFHSVPTAERNLTDPASCRIPRRTVTMNWGRRSRGKIRTVSGKYLTDSV